MRYTLALLSLFALQLSFAVSAQTLNLREFNDDILGSYGTRWFADQHNNGTVFMSSVSGLYSWDGATWRHHPKPGNQNMRQFVLQDERIYVGVEGDFGVFEPAANGELKYRSLAAAITELADMTFINNVLPLGSYIAFIAPEVITLWHPQQDPIFIRPKHRFSRAWKTGNKMYATDGTELLVTSPQATHTYLSFERPLPGRLGFVQEYAGKLLLGFFQHGVFAYDQGELVPWLNSSSPLASSGFYNSRILQSGDLAVASIRNGVMTFAQDGTLRHHFNTQAGLPNNVTLNVFEDNQLGLWFLQEGSVSRAVAPEYVQVFTQRDSGLSKIRAMASLDQSLFLAGINGLGQLNDNRKINFVRDSITSLSEVINFQQSLLLAGATACQQYFPLNQRVNNFVSTAFCRDMLVPKQHPYTVLAITEKGVVSSQYSPASDTWSAPRLLLSNKNLSSALVEDQQGRVYTADANGNLYAFSAQHNQWQGMLAHTYAEEIIPLVILGQLYISGSEAVHLFSAESAESQPLPPWFEQMQTYLGASATDVFVTTDGVHWVTNGERSYRVWRDQNQAIRTAKGFDNLVALTGLRSVYQFDNAYWFGYENGFAKVRTEVPYVQHQPTVVLAQIEKLASGEVLASNVFTTPEMAEIDAGTSVKLTFGYSDFNARQVDYSYRLEGEEWSRPQAQAYVDFPKPSAQQIPLTLRAESPYAAAPAIAIRLNFKPFWYQRGWFYVLCVLLVVLSVTAVIKVYSRVRFRQLKAARVQLKQQVRQRTKTIREQALELKKLHAVKDRFFANVSHELRTPLTLIRGPLQLLKSRSVLREQSDNRQLSIALSNTELLLTLINQILDMQKLSAQSELALTAECFDPLATIQQTVQRFSSMSTKKQIRVSLAGAETGDGFWFDKGHFEKICSNLLHNALKFSAQQGAVDITLVQVKDQFVLTFSDKGIGLSEEGLKHVFQRFWQEQSHHSAQPGTGIGLSLVAELVRQNRSTIRAFNNDNRGCTFELTIPCSNQRYAPDQIYQPGDNQQTAVQYQALPQIATSDGEPPLVLIIEDNTDMQEFIQECLRQYFRTALANNGSQGIAVARDLMPDFIVSDVMMPGADGNHVCQSLKADLDTAHIPVLLLSARAAVDDKVRGLIAGASDYLTKPFEANELVARIHAQLQQRAMHARKLLESQTVSPVERASQNANKNPEYEKIAACVEQHYNDADFSVDAFANALFMDRTTLFRKVKTHFNMSPNQLIRSYRLNAGKKLLEAGGAPVSEVAYAVGFQSHNYFTRSFKELFNVNPSDLVH